MADETRFAIKITLFIFGLVVAMVMLMLWLGGYLNKHDVMPPPVEAPATTAREEIVTCVCDFGGCPVATTAATPTLPPTTESLTTVNLTKPPQNLTTAEAAENKVIQVDYGPETEATSQNEEETSQNEAVAENATTELETEPLTAEHVSETYTLTEEPATEHTDPAAIYSASYFRKMGVIWWNGWRWTWYSERVLPGTGLNIPGRHTEGGYVRDGNGYICLASDLLGYGTVIETPFGSYGKVYDCGCGFDTIDVYVWW